MSLINIKFRGSLLSGSHTSRPTCRQTERTDRRIDGHDIPYRCFLRLSESRAKMVVNNTNSAV